MKSNLQPAAPPRIQTCSSSRKGSRSITGLLACITGLLACHAPADTTTVYDFQSLTAATGGGTVAVDATDLNGQDNWSADTNISVILDSGTGDKFVSGWENAYNIQNGNRPNDLNFAMTVPASVTQFSLSADIRYGTFNSGGQNHRRSLFGLTVGSGNFLFGAGGDDTQDNKWLIQTGDGTQNFSTAVTSSVSSTLGIIRLDVNLLANDGNGAASLYLDNVAISDLQNINLNLLSLTGYSNGSSFDGMAISSGDFGRLDDLTLSYIPLPTGGFTGWINTNYPDLTDKTAGGDPDFDGITNLMEYALNGNPGASSTEILPAADNSDPTDLIFTFTRREESATDTTQVFQYGTDLSGWTDINITGTPGVEVTLGTPALGLQLVTVKIPKSAANPSAKLFGRLQVTQP